jgi:hypothetical protein
MNELSYYRTPDINLASTLFTLGIGIDGIYAVKDMERMEFYFKQTPKLNQMIADYWARTEKLSKTRLDNKLRLSFEAEER